MAKRFKTTGDLVRMALVYAIGDRDAYADSGAGPYSAEAAQEAAEFRAYLKSRFNYVTANDRLNDVPSVSIYDIPITK